MVKAAAKLAKKAGKAAKKAGKAKTRRKAIKGWDYDVEEMRGEIRRKVNADVAKKKKDSKRRNAVKRAKEWDAAVTRRRPIKGWDTSRTSPPTGPKGFLDPRGKK